MLKRICFTFLLLEFSPCVLFAQNEFYKLNALSLDNLASFKSPGKNWKIVGNTYGSFDSKFPKSEKGKGVLLNDYDEKIQFKSEANLFTELEHGDIFLSLDFMIPKGSNSGIYLQGRYEIQLFDSWSVTVPRASDCGGIYERWDENRPNGKKGYDGHPARTNACFAPNLWQHLEIEFRAPRFDSNGKKIAPARFVKVVLNGVVIHENIFLSGPTRAAAFTDEKSIGPLMIQGDHGPVAFRNISYAMLDDFKIDFKDLSYEYFEGNFNDFPRVESSHLVRKGKADAIDVKLADNPNKQCLIFTGTMDFKESTAYQFIIKKIGKAKLSIDGEEIIRTNDLFRDFSITKTLSAGEHTIVFSYLKDFSWAPTGMGLFIGKLNSRPQALHTPNSLPPLPPTPLIAVKPQQQPEIIRSFMEHLGKKKTHVISIGDPSAIHYAYDLNQAGIIKTWKGDFLDVTEMWHERGEPQTAQPMGAALTLKGKAPLALLADVNGPLPDTLDDRTELIYKGYTLNTGGYPVFSYHFKYIIFEDSFVPASDRRGLTRSINIPKMPATETLLVRMGEGSQITEVSENVFSIDGRYYVQFLPSGKLKPAIRSTGEQKELLVEVKTPFPVVIKYNLLW